MYIRLGRHVTWHVAHVRSVRKPGPRHEAHGTPSLHWGPHGGTILALLLKHGLLPQHLLLLLPLNGS